MISYGQRLFAQLILVTDKKVTVVDWFRYGFNLTVHFAPLLFVMNVVQWWFNDNKLFAQSLLFCLIVNAIIGAYAHLHRRTFNFIDFIKKNCGMIVMLIAVYSLLEVLRYTVGNNIAGDAFRSLIQVMTLLYPISKSVKNIFILSKGKYPPEFLMRKLYNFEKNGDLNKFFSHESTNETEDGFDDYKNELINSDKNK